MTRKHSAAIARILAAYTKDPHLISAIADYIESQNSSFNRHKFLDQAFGAKSK